MAGEALSNFQNLQKLKIGWGSGGLATEDDGSEEQQSSDQSNATRKGEESKKNVKDAGKLSKSKNKASKAANKPQSEKQNKGKDGGVIEGDDTSKKQGSENGSQGAGIRSTAKAIVFAKKLRGGKKAKDREGLGKLVKLDLQCFPRSEPPGWLVPSKMAGLKNLSIRGGKLGCLIQEDEEKWEVEKLRLKFLTDFKMNWKEMRVRFPKLEYLEKVRCPRITFCPCDAKGVWQLAKTEVGSLN